MASGGGICEPFPGGSDTTILNGNTIEDNIAVISGWGIGGGVALYDSRGTIIFNDNSILNNTATISGTIGHGGGVVIANGNTAIFNHNVLQGNIAPAYGGGMYLGATDATLINTVVVDNRATRRGAWPPTPGTSISSSSEIILPSAHPELRLRHSASAIGVRRPAATSLTMSP